MSPRPDRSAAYENLVETLLEQINRGRSFDELFNCIYEQLQGIVPYNRIAVALLTDAGDQLTLVACRSDGPEELKIGYADAIAGSTLAELLRTGQPRILNDLAAYLKQKPESRSTRLIVREGMRSNLTLPLLADDRPIGVVFFSCRQTEAYADKHVHLLRRIAGHLAVAVEKAKLIDVLQEKNKELLAASELQEQFLEKLQQEVRRQTRELKASEERYRLLVSLSGLVNASLELRTVFGAVAGEIHALLGCDRVSLILGPGTTGTRRGFAREFGAAEKWFDLPEQELADTAAGWVMQHRKPRLARDLDRARPFIEDKRLFEQGYHAYAYFPLLCRDAAVGVLGLAARQSENLEHWDLALLHELCPILATALDHAAAYSQIAELQARLEKENIYLRAAAGSGRGLADLVGASAAMRGVRDGIEQVAATDSTVLILGETGTGKERIARAIHDLSSRRDRLLVTVNCAALAPGVVGSELFGHEAGAFTGAVKQRLGRFELAQRGTLFLDEIAEIPPETQVLLLRVLQERLIERVGGSTPIPVDVRIIAATNRDLGECVRDGSFRADLFYRLNVFPIRVPPLRERRDDIPDLAAHFLDHFRLRMHRPITEIAPQTLDLLTRYDWPGNVRELENIIERAMIVSRGPSLELDPTWLSTSNELPASDSSTSLSAQERQAILDALHRCGGKIYGPDGAAKLLGLKPTTLYGKMRKQRIRRRKESAEFE